MSRRFRDGPLGSLSKDVFEGRTSTGSEPFSLFICLDANKFVLLSFFSLIKRIYPRVSNKPLPNDAKGPLPVDVRRSTTLLLKLPIRKVMRRGRGIFEPQDFFSLPNSFHEFFLGLIGVQLRPPPNKFSNGPSLIITDQCIVRHILGHFLPRK